MSSDERLSVPAGADSENGEAPSGVHSRGVVAATTGLAALLLGTVFIRSYDPDSFNHDVGLVLYFAEQILAGARLYVDLIDENPPLIFWLSTGPVWLARSIGAEVIVVFNIVVAGLAFAAAALGYRIARGAWRSASPAHLLASAGLLLCVELLTPGRDYGQRDGLFFIAVGPYLIAAAARAGGRPVALGLALAAGALASVGLALKPHFVVLWLSVEAWLSIAARGQWRRAENVAVVAGGVLYFALVVVFAWDYFAVVGDSFQLLGAYYEATALSLLTPQAIVLVVAATGISAFVRPSTLDRDARHVMWAAMFGFVAVAMLQGKGWSYHYYPAQAAALFVLGVVALGLASRARFVVDALGPRTFALPLVMILLLSVWGFRGLAAAQDGAFGAGPDRPTLVRMLTKLVEERAPGQPILLMSTSVLPAFPVVNLTGSTWASRFPCFWYLSGSYSPEQKRTTPFPYHRLDEMGDRERFALDAVIEDLETYQPKLLIIHRPASLQTFGESDFDFLRYFQRDPRFVAIFASYDYLGDVGPYRVFERSGPGPRPSAARTRSHPMP